MCRDIERQGMILAESLAIPIMNALLYERLGLIEEGGLIDNYISEIFENKDIDLIYLLVLDEVGRVSAHNDFNEYGKVYRDDITVNAVSSKSTIMQKYYDKTIGQKAIDFATPLSIGKKRWGTLKFGVSLEKVDKEIQATVLKVVIFTTMLLAGGLIIITILSRRFIRPITELARTMEVAGGDLIDIKVNAKEGGDEISLLGKSFNRMIERIRESNLEQQKNHERLLRFASAVERTGGDLLDVNLDMVGSDEITLLGKSFNRMIERIRQSNIELKQTHEKLLRSQKLASLGILASGVAHEINNPLGGMFNCIEMLDQMGDNKDFRQRYLKLLKDGLNRIENTVGKLLWMSRKEEKNPRPVSVQQALDDMYGFVEYRMKNGNIDYRTQVEDSVSVMIDPYDLQQILINLIINAIQSMKKGGALRVNAYNHNPNVMLEVSDTGKGIDEEELNNIFDPFYTTKNPGEGTGLGLWLTYEIVKHYDGDITVRSKKGHGTTFSIMLNSAG
jgi:signal transduction histidine kinase